MTTTVTRPTISYVDHTVLGLPDHVAAVIRRHHQAGTFIAMAAPRPVAPGDPRIRVQIRLAEPAAATTWRTSGTVYTRPDRAVTSRRQPTSVTRTGRRVGIALTITTAAIGLVFALGHLAAQLTAAAITHAAATVAGLAAITAIVTALLRGGSSGRRHCPGCN